jgi:hypothetical protein
MVFFGFMAAWFFADSPIKRSLSVKETNDGVVKLPCSLATGHLLAKLQDVWLLTATAIRLRVGSIVVRTDLDIVTLVVCDTRVGGSCHSMYQPPSMKIRVKKIRRKKLPLLQQI